MEGFKGIFTAALTPFDNEGRINEKALERLIEMNIKKGVTGFYVGGSTAEAFLMSADERKKLLELTVQIVNGRAKIISHIGCISTDAAIDLARHAEAHGADIISSVAPFYYKFSFEEIKSYYYDIVNSMSKPMLIYNFPSFSGVTYTLSVNGEAIATSELRVRGQGKAPDMADGEQNSDGAENMPAPRGRGRSEAPAADGQRQGGDDCGHRPPMPPMNNDAE